MFTDNFMAESAFYKGTFSSKWLFDLVICLRCLQMSGAICLHVIHIAGTRIDEGTDGLSHGDLMAGVMLGHDILTYVPLHLDAITRHPPLRDWVLGWYSISSPKWLTHEDWFDVDISTIIAFGRPHQLRLMLLLNLWQRPSISDLHPYYVIIMPRLLTSRWRNFFSKFVIWYLQKPWLLMFGLLIFTNL
jgi:hypothetical protein